MGRSQRIRQIVLQSRVENLGSFLRRIPARVEGTVALKKIVIYPHIVDGRILHRAQPRMWLSHRSIPCLSPCRTTMM